MNKLVQNAERYLSGFADSPVQLSPEAGGALPLVLRERYDLRHARLFGRDWLMAVEAEGWDAGTPSEYREQARQLTQVLGKQVVLVFSSLSSNARNRLVQMNVPFLVPEVQIFIPVSLINLRELYPRQEAQAGKKLTPTAQVLVLHQILKSGLESLSSKQIAGKLNYSEMAISKARNELQVNHLCETLRKGKELRMEFTVSAQSLWQQASPLLRSPVARIHWVQWNQPVADAKQAGISALSERGLLADDEIPTFAIKKNDFQRHLEQGSLHGSLLHDDAHARVEAWNYDPALLSDDPAVDPQSLYLSLRETPDERVQAELTAMMEDFSWR